jgi:hypothetical protein
VVVRHATHMTVRRTADARRARVTKICFAFPETVDRGPGQHTAFEVRGKKFAYFLDDHHGDGRLSVCMRAASGENDALVAADPRRYFIPAYIGPRGWVGYYLDVGGEDWGEVTDLLTESYRLAAPRRLAAQLDVSE